MKTQSQAGPLTIYDLRFTLLHPSGSDPSWLIRPLGMMKMSRNNAVGSKDADQWNMTCSFIHEVDSLVQRSPFGEYLRPS
jgi:hypothetical protein